MLDKPDKYDLFFADLPTKIFLAGELFQGLRVQLGADRRIQETLDDLDRLAEELRRQMRRMGMFELCSWCGTRKEGGCCSAEMAGETDALLLVSNLLLGCEVKAQRVDSPECRFLGFQGCSLRLKPTFCLNYNCHRILAGNAAEELAALAKATADLHGRQLMLEELLLDHFQQWKGGGKSPASGEA